MSDSTAIPVDATPVTKNFMDCLADNTPSVAQVRNAAAASIPVVVGCVGVVLSIMQAMSAGSLLMGLLVGYCCLALTALIVLLLVLVSNEYIRVKN